MVLKGIGIIIFLSVLSALPGCAGSPPRQDSQQSSIGLGIVEGTKGYQQILQEQDHAAPLGRGLRGQVTKIEGGAYVIRDLKGDNLRLPLDQNTRIDRPAHIGDWIEAHLDQGGRAVNIRNIDHRVFLE